VTDVSRKQQQWSAIIGAKLFLGSHNLSHALYESANWNTVPSAYRPALIEVEDLGPPIAIALASALASNDLKEIRDAPAPDPHEEADAVATIVIPRIKMPASGTPAYSAWTTAVRPMTRALWVELRGYLDVHPRVRA
jgi:hypothetical protein